MVQVCCEYVRTVRKEDVHTKRGQILSVFEQICMLTMVIVFRWIFLKFAFFTAGTHTADEITQQWYIL